MSRTKHGNKGPGYDYWGKRPMKGSTSPAPHKATKITTHRLERRHADRALLKGVRDDWGNL